MTTDLPMPAPRWLYHGDTLPGRWTLHPTTAMAPYDCNPQGIANRCHGKCCRSSAGFWPGGLRGALGCVHLSDTGCTLGAGRPVACHLYPLVINDRGTLVLHGMTRWPAVCAGNRGAEGAPPLVVSLRPGLAALFGEAEADAAYVSAVAGADHVFVVPGWVLAAMRQEAAWAAAGVPPEPRP